MDTKNSLCFLASVLAITLGRSTMAIVAIAFIVLINIPAFWSWMAQVREVTSQWLRVRRD